LPGTSGRGTGGHLTRLRRTRSGPFIEEQAVGDDDATDTHVISPRVFLGHLPSVDVEGDDENAVAHGRALRFYGPDGDICIFNKEGDLLAVASVKDGWAHPKVVLI
jgi:tRNA pseudouridine55 synthase